MSRQEQICYGENKFATAKTNLLRRKQICYGENKFATAKTNLLRRKQICYGENKFATAKTNLLRREAEHVFDYQYSIFKIIILINSSRIDQGFCAN